jgi:aspartate aminotransferase
MIVSEFAASIEPSATLAAGTRAKKLKAQGIEVFDFTLGEPDFDTPAHIQDAALAAMRSGKTHYTPANGVPELRAAIAAYHKARHGLDYAPDDICVSSGCKHAIHTALAAVVNRGDEVIIPAPYWVSYSDLVRMVGGVPVLVTTDFASGYKMSAAQLRAALTPRSKLLMLNSPSNPTGAVYSRAELEAIADVVLDSPLAVLTDEIYDRLVYGSAVFTPFANLRPGLAARTLTINGVSKSWAMTGWRIGWTCGPTAVVKAMGDIQSQETGNPSSVSQYAAIAALTGPQDCVEVMRVEFEKRRGYAFDRLAKMPGMRCFPSDGAFYAWVDMSAWVGRTLGGVTITNSKDFTMAALDQPHVAMVQGSAFGAENHIRMSYACSLESIRRGFDTLENWLRSAG